MEVRDIPKTLKSFRTILIRTNEKNRSDPRNLRPIFMGSNIQRVFSKILHNRIESSLKLNKRQKEFT